MLAQGASYCAPLLPRVQQRVLVLVGAGVWGSSGRDCHGCRNVCMSCALMPAGRRAGREQALGSHPSHPMSHPLSHSLSCKLSLLQVGDGDVLIPSAEEGPRLLHALPRATLRVMKGHSHALLQVRPLPGSIPLVWMRGRRGRQRGIWHAGTGSGTLLLPDV